MTVEGTTPAGGKVEVNASNYAETGNTYDQDGARLDLTGGGRFFVDSGAGEQSSPILNITAPSGYKAEIKMGNGSYSNAASNHNLGVITQETSITIKFTQQSGTNYVLTYDANGGQNAPGSDSVSLPAGQTSIQHNLAAKGGMNKSGNAFVGWSETRLNDLTATSPDPATVTAVTVSGNKTVYAVWGVDSNNNGIWDKQDSDYTISFAKGDYNAAVVPASQQVASGAVLPSITNPTGNTVYTFSGWKCNLDGAVYQNIAGYNGGKMPAQNVVMTAQWTKKLNVAHVAGTTALKPQETVTIPADSKEYTAEVGSFDGYAFSAATPGQKYTFTGLETAIPTIKMNYVASSGVNVCTVYVKLSGVLGIGGYDANNERTILVVRGTPVIVNAPAVNGYDVSPATKALAAADTNQAEYKTVIFTYTRASTGGGGGGGTTNYKLTFVTNGGSEIQPLTVNANTNVTLAQKPVWAGHIFMGWYLDSALTQSATEIKMTGNKTVYAKWIPGNDSSVNGNVPPILNGENHSAYLNGFSDGGIHPMDNITRAEVATIFYRLLKDEARKENMTSSNTFSDVAATDWFNTAVSTMAKLGIVKGRSDGTYAPGANITRAEFAAIAARFDNTPYTGTDKFNDIANSWAREDINRAAARGWIQGDGSGNFYPNSYITRAEAVTMINRVLGRSPGSVSDLLTNMKTWTDNMDSTAWYYLPIQEASNSHDYERTTNITEKWTKLSQSPDWSTK